MKVIAFNGSPRKNGNTHLLIQKVFDVLNGEGIQTESVQIGDKALRGCIACMRCMENRNKKCACSDDALNEYIQKMIGAEGILLASPVYFGTLTAGMKALIERAGFVSRANGNLFKRKVGAAVMAVRRAGAIMAYSEMNLFFGINEMIIPSSSYWNLAIGRNPGEVLNDEEGLKTMETLGENMAWLMKKLF
jgi:multimeric flavodoxin WrbA